MSNVSSYIGELYHLVYSWYNKNRKLRCTNGPAVIGATGTHSVGIVMVSATAQMALLLFMQMVNRDGILMVSYTAQMACLLWFVQMGIKSGIVMANATAQMVLLLFMQMAHNGGIVMVNATALMALL